MTEDRAVRDALGAYLDLEPSMNLTVDTVLAAGRRRRTVRQAATAAVTGTTVAAVAFGLYGVIGPSHASPALPSSGRGAPVSGPAVTSATSAPVVVSGGVYGGPVAALIRARVKAALPGEPLTLRQLYPSDWNRDTALPPDQAANATDWHGIYKLGNQPKHEFWVSVLINPPGMSPAIPPDACKDVGGPAICVYPTLPDGSKLIKQIHTSGDNVWSVTLINVRGGSRSVNVRERLSATSQADATSKMTLSLPKLKQLATDPQLKIPQPKVLPTYPPN
jgi:hypothetical protein